MKIIQNKTYKTYLTKSRFPIADKFALEGFLCRYPEHLYSVVVEPKKKCYLVIATPKFKIEEV